MHRPASSRKSRTIVLAAIAAVGLPASTAMAQQTITVPTDLPTLSLALNPAVSGLAPGDTIELLGTTGYFESYTIATPDITIRGLGASPVEINPFGTGRAFNISADGGTTRFENLRIVNGAAGGASGGAIYTISGDAVEISGCEFDANAGGQGGAVYAGNAEVFVESSVFTNNSTTGRGGALHTFSNGANGEIVVSITDSVFDSNTATDENGGAFYHTGVNSGVNALITISDSQLRNNTCAGSGGGGLSNEAPSVSVTRCEFIDNASLGTGSEDTGGLFLGGVADAVVRDTLFEGNTCPGSGGALRFSSSAGGVFGCRFVDNEASAGGALQVLGAGTRVRVFNSVFDGNSSRGSGSESGEGGAVLVNGGFAEVFVWNSLFINNTAVTGGAVTASFEGEAFIDNSTFWNNDADAIGGAVRRLSATADTVLNNCVVWGNFPSDQQININGSGLDEVNFSLVEGGYDTEPGRNNIDADPMFVDPVGGDFSLMPGSPAIDAGSSILYGGRTLTDLGGNARGQDDPATVDTGEAFIGAVIDMGAFEFTAADDDPIDICPADIDGDELIDLDDLLTVLGQFGNPCP